MTISSNNSVNDLNKNVSLFNIVTIGYLEKKPKTTTLQIDDAAIHATSLICDDAPKRALRRRKKRKREEKGSYTQDR